MDGWVTVTECSFCHGKRLDGYKSVNTAPFLYVDFCGGILPVLTTTQYIQCSECGLVIQSPRMTDERIGDYYSSGLYRGTLGMSAEAMDADEKRRAEDVRGWLSRNNVKPERHLDIGCSRGYLLQGVGAEIKHGFDSNPAYSKDIYVHTDKSKLRKYDLVTAIHVLEHTINPVKEIEWYASLTSDLLLIEVPGLACKGGPLRFAHLYYFPPELLASTIRAAGLKILAVETEPNTRILSSIVHGDKVTI